MRKTIGLILMGLFAFFLVTALMGWFYAPGSTQRTPLNVNSTTLLDGTATYLGKGPAPVKAYSKTVIDGAKSNGSTAVFTNTSCLWYAASPTDCPSAADGDSLISASEDTFATDRHTAVAVQQGTYKHEGLINKFPFSTEKKTYAFWDDLLAKTVDATFQGEESVKGLKTDKFVIAVPEQTAEISDGVTGTYSDDKTMWIEPVTGTIINQTDHQVRKLDTGDTALDLTLGFTDAQVAANVKDTDPNVSKLRIVGLLPNIAIALSLLSLLGGLALLLGGGGRSGGDRAATKKA